MQRNKRFSLANVFARPQCRARAGGTPDGPHTLQPTHSSSEPLSRYSTSILQHRGPQLCLQPWLQSSWHASSELLREPGQKKKEFLDNPPGGPSRLFALELRHWLPVREMLEALVLLPLLAVPVPSTLRVTARWFLQLVSTAESSTLTTQATLLRFAKLDA